MNGTAASGDPLGGCVPAFCTPAPTFCAVSRGIRTPAGSVVFRASDLASCFSFFFFFPSPVKALVPFSPAARQAFHGMFKST